MIVLFDVGNSNIKIGIATNNDESYISLPKLLLPKCFDAICSVLSKVSPHLYYKQKMNKIFLIIV